MTSLTEIIPHIESLIFASDKALTSLEITDLINSAFGFMEEKVVIDQVEASIEGIVEKYNSEFYPFEVKQSGGGWQFLTKKEFHKTVAQLNGEKFLKRLSSAALETLAIVAYKQPVTKGEIESIRGVSSDYAMQKLLEKELIVITGRNEKMPGHPLIYTTSKNFMDYFGINSAEDLPKIREVLADQLVEPTVVNRTDLEQDELLAVTNDGELTVIDDDIRDDSEVTPLVVSMDEAEEASQAETDAPMEKTESIEDEMAVEEFISDEIFVAEDEVIEEQEISEELSQGGDEEKPLDDLEYPDEAIEDDNEK